MKLIFILLATLMISGCSGVYVHDISEGSLRNSTVREYNPDPLNIFPVEPIWIDKKRIPEKPFPGERHVKISEGTHEVIFEYGGTKYSYARFIIRAEANTVYYCTVTEKPEKAHFQLFKEGSNTPIDEFFGDWKERKYIVIPVFI